MSPAEIVGCVVVGLVIFGFLGCFVGLGVITQKAVRGPRCFGCGKPCSASDVYCASCNSKAPGVEL